MKPLITTDRVIFIIAVLVFSFILFSMAGATNLKLGLYIKPHYNIIDEGDSLWINTNMDVYVNGNKVN